MILISNRLHRELIADLPSLLAQAKCQAMHSDDFMRANARRRISYNLKKLEKAKKHKPLWRKRNQK